MEGIFATVLDYFRTPLLPRSAGELLRRKLPFLAIAVLSAVVLVHAFSPAGLSMVELVTHILTVWIGFMLGMMAAAWLVTKVLARQAKHPSVGLVWLISAAGFTLGLVFIGGLDSVGFLEGTAHKAAALHGPRSMLLRLVPVWVLVTAYLVRSEILEAYETRFEALEPAHKAQAPAGDDRQAVHLGAGKSGFSVRAATILLVSAEENYCKVVTRADEGVSSTLVRATLQSVEDALADPRFIRIHRSHLVNAERVERVRRRGRQFYALLGNAEEEIPISRQRCKAVLARLEAVELGQAKVPE